MTMPRFLFASTHVLSRRPMFPSAPAAFVRRYRLDVAAQLLEQEAGTVSEVAYKVGFGTPETFTTRFEERFGCCPSAYPDAASSDAASSDAPQ